MSKFFKMTIGDWIVLGAVVAFCLIRLFAPVESSLNIFTKAWGFWIILAILAPTQIYRLLNSVPKAK